MFISRGKKRVRVAADLSYFISNGLSEQWYKLEDAIESKSSLPISVLCSYDSLSSKVWDTDVLKYYLEADYDHKEFVDVHKISCIIRNNLDYSFWILYRFLVLMI